MAQELSAKLFKRAKDSIPGGVNSPVRSFQAVNAPPVLINSGKGAYIKDVDNNSYIDFLNSWGAIILGHADEDVQAAIREAAERGTGFGLSTPIECELAEIIKKAFPSIELLRMVNSGTEAVMSAVRLARGYTGRDKIIMFEGCYHGHSDGLLARAGSGLQTFSIPASKGVLSSSAGETLIAEYNNLESVVTIAQKFPDDIACILVEPVAGNMGVIPPAPGFLNGLCQICDKIGALLIFDEVITGFRISFGGAQEKFGIKPDITTLGKIIGGGLPIGAFGGRRKIMEKLAPVGDVYQAGTLSGNPVVASAGKAVLEKLHRLNPYDELNRKTLTIAESIRKFSSDINIPVQINAIGSMFTVFFTEKAVTNYGSAKKADSNLYSKFFKNLLANGILFPPSQWESGFVNLSLSDPIFSTAIEKIKKGIQSIR